MSGGCLEGILKVTRRFLEGFQPDLEPNQDDLERVGVRKVSGRCLEGVWRVSGNCLEGVWNVSGTLPNLILSNQTNIINLTNMTNLTD